MKKITALFLVVCTLAGCANTAPAEETTATAVATTEITTTAQNTTSASTAETTAKTTSKPEKTDLFPDEVLYPVSSDEATEVIFFEIAEGVKYENEEDFPNQEHLQLAKETYWADNTAQEKIAEYNNSSWREEYKYEKIESIDDLKSINGYHYDFDMDGENESFVFIQSTPYAFSGVLIYVNDGKAEIVWHDIGGAHITVYSFDDFCYATLHILYSFSGVLSGIYDLRNGFSEPLVSGTNCEYENGVFHIYRKAEFTEFPVICCADGILRQAGKEEITREDFEMHVKNGAEYLSKLEAQEININKIETWGHYTYQLTCTERGADFGINIRMSDDEAAYIRAPYEVANEPKLTEEHIYGVDVWNLKDSSVIVPEVTFDSNVSIEKSFIHSDIENQLRTEKPVDASVYDWYDEIRAEAEKQGGEEAKNAKANNYTYIDIHNAEYVGNEKADWIVPAHYYPRTGGLIPSFLSRIFYVKDGKITQYLAEFESDCYINSYDGRIFVSAYNDGIYELNLKTDKLEKIVDAEIVWERPHQNFCRCFAATSEYMIYKDAEECLKIYYFDSGKIFKTDIYSGWQDGQAFGIHGDSLIYMPMNTDSNEYAELNIMTGELSTSDISYEEFRNLLSDFKNESDSYLIKPFYPYNGLPDIITVKSKADGKTKKFDIKTVLEQLGYKLYSFYALGVDGDKFYCYSSSEKCYLVFDLSQNTMRVIRHEGNSYPSVSFDSSQIEVYDGKQNYILNINPPSLFDEKGMLTEDYTEQINKLIRKIEHGVPYVALQDFDGDDFPEIVIVEHNSGQGLMPCKIYDANTLEYMGEFEGFCRDGFTNFYETADGVVVYNYYEHSVHSRYEGYSLIENIDGIFTERIVSSETGFFNVCGAENAGIIWENSAGYKGIRYEAEGYCVSSFGYDIDASKAGKFVVDFYNNCKQIENIYIRELCEIESFSIFEAPLLAIGDYDMDGKPEAFYQLGINKPLCFIDSEHNISVIESPETSDNGYYAASAYKLWNGIIVFQGMGNSVSCLIYTVKNGKPTEITELSGKGMMFDYSRFYNGCYELCDSEYDGPYHTWKPYIYYCDADGWHEYSSIEISAEEFLSLYGDEAQEILDRIAAMETPVENSGSWEVRSILYRSDNTYIINYGWNVCNEHIIVKPGVTENDRLIEYPDYGGVYATAFIPELAVYPDSTHPDFDF